MRGARELSEFAPRRKTARPLGVLPPEESGCSIVLRLGLLGVFFRDQQENAADKGHEDERAYAKCRGVGLRSLVDVPAADAHGDHPGQGNDEPAY